MAACKAIQDVMVEIRETGNSVSVWDRMMTFEDFWKVGGLPEIRTLEARYGV